LPAAALAALALCACSPKARLQLHAGPRPSAPLPVKVALVGPVSLRWEEPTALLAFVRAQDVGMAIAARGQMGVVGPGQLGLGPNGAPQELEQADLYRVALKLGLKPEELLVVKPWAERRVAQSAAHLTNREGKAAGQALAAEVVLVAHVEVSHFATHAQLVEVAVEGQSDPFADHSPLDAQPELAALLVQATSAALDQLLPALQPLPKVELGLSLVPGPGPALSYGPRPQRSLREGMQALDELQQDVTIDQAVALWAGDLGEAEQRALRRAPVGLLVREAKGAAAAAGLQPGDVLAQVNGAPASRPWDLLTASRLAPAKPLQLTVRRGAGDLSVALPLLPPKSEAAAGAAY
jgi:PDZ domain